MAAAILPLIPVVLGMIPGVIGQVNNLITMLRAMGLSDEEIMAHIAASEAKLDPLVLKLASFQIQRHPDDR